MKLQNELLYRSTIKSRPFFYIETKNLADLVTQGMNEFEIRKRDLENNIFQVKTESRKKEVASVILNRFKVLDKYLIEQITISDVATSKLIAFYAILKTDRLLYEFMHEVYREKVGYQDLVIKDRDFNVFFETKRQHSAVIAGWKEYTLDRKSVV